MGYCLTAFTYFLLSAGVLTQVVAFLTSHLQDNDINDQHKGLFIECSVGKCVWFNINDFSNKTVWLKVVITMSFISIGVVALLSLFSLINLIQRFKTRALHVFIASMLILNMALIAGIVTLYITQNSEGVQFSGGYSRYSWSLWLLFVTMALNGLTSLCFCLSIPKTGISKFN